MKILRLKADGFGSLRGEFHFDPARLTLVVDRNEAGKSTLLAAIAAALYGLEKDQRAHKPITPLERFRPWDGGSYRVEISIEQDGERYDIRRDFLTHTVSVWDARGRERTEEFREGKDDFPVGRFLLGLDSAEFEKSAFLKAGELDQVVPDEEKERRGSTLWRRLENAADTRVGDTNALEALHAIAEAAGQYACAEASNNRIKVESALQKLELRDHLLDEAIAELTNEREQLAQPLEEIARLVAEERHLRECVAALEGDRRRARLAEIDERLRRDDARRRELERLRAELADLAERPRLSAEAAATLVALSGRIEEAQRQREERQARRALMAEDGRLLAAQGDELLAYQSLLGVDTDALAARALELRRVEAELDRARHALEALHPGAHDGGENAAHAAIFERLPAETHEALRVHPARLIAFQTRAVEATTRKDEGRDTMVTIDRTRRRASIPGWIALALGLALGGAAAAAFAIAGPWLPLGSAALVLLIAGLVGLIRAGGHRGRERRAAHEQVEAAEAEMSLIRSDQIAYRESVERLAAALGASDFNQALERWNAYRAWADERRPVEPLEREIAGLDRRRIDLGVEIREALGDTGDEAPDPARVEVIASGVRRLAALRARQDEHASELDAIDRETARHAQLLADHESHAARIFAEAGVPHRPDRPLAQQMPAARAAAEAATQWTRLVSESLPDVAAGLLDPDARLALERERDALAVAPEAAPGVDRAPPAPAEVELELARLRERLDDLTARREELRTRFEERARRGQAELAERTAERERVAVARGRAARFKAALDLARTTIEEVAWETHRTWAEFLTRRVTEIVRTMGTDILEVRFGEDLDFSIKLPNGHPVPRGRGLRQLSSGARDQLHLAVRVAISEFLSRGRAPLPLLIDDAFVTSDDERARAGMNLLLRHLSREHQIVLVTCHRRRHEGLAELDRELWSERAHWIDTSVPEVEYRPR